MKRIRGGRGLGDSLYVRVVCEHYIASGEKVTALSDYQDVFIGSGAEVEPFSRNNNITTVAHYTAGKNNPHTTQWQDVCKSAGIGGTLPPLRFAWPVKNHGLIDGLRALAAGRPLVLVHGGREPMNRTDGYGLEMVPLKETFDTVLSAIGDCLLVQIGRAPQIYPLSCEVTLNGSTSVADILDLGAACDAVVGQCSFAVPLAEVFDKPLLGIWAIRGLQSQTAYIRNSTPQKILCGEKSRHVVDNQSTQQLKEGAIAFRRSF